MALPIPTTSKVLVTAGMLEEVMEEVVITKGPSGRGRILPDRRGD
jgi:hypothetical protein